MKLKFKQFLDNRFKLLEDWNTAKQHKWIRISVLVSAVCLLFCSLVFSPTTTGQPFIYVGEILFFVWLVCYLSKNPEKGGLRLAQVMAGCGTSFIPVAIMICCLYEKNHVSCSLRNKLFIIVILVLGVFALIFFINSLIQEYKGRFSDSQNKKHAAQKLTLAILTFLTAIFSLVVTLFDILEKLIGAGF